MLQGWVVYQAVIMLYVCQLYFHSLRIRQRLVRIELHEDNLLRNRCLRFIHVDLCSQSTSRTAVAHQSTYFDNVKSVVWESVLQIIAERIPQHKHKRISFIPSIRNQISRDVYLDFCESRKQPCVNICTWIMCGLTWSIGVWRLDEQSSSRSRGELSICTLWLYIIVIISFSSVSSELLKELECVQKVWN